MRRVLYVVLILLLPMRAWLGDAMAMQMAVPTPVQHAMSADASHHAGSPAHAHGMSLAVQHAAVDCAGHADQNSDSDHDDTAHCGTCAMCQTCHTVAVLQPVADPDAGLTNATAPGLPTQGFTSADRALALKPPKF